MTVLTVFFQATRHEARNDDDDSIESDVLGSLFDG